MTITQDGSVDKDIVMTGTGQAISDAYVHMSLLGVRMLARSIWGPPSRTLGITVVL